MTPLCDAWCRHFGRTLMDAMKALTVVPLLCATAWPMAGLAAKAPVQPCVITYSIIEKDTLGNVNQGASGKTLKWLTDDLERKYPGVCYALPSPNVRTVLLITVAPAVYHGTRLISNNEDTTGHISDTDGNSATYSGTTTSTTAVPYSFDYGKYMLTVETLGPNEKVTVNRRFAQDGIYRTMYGIPLGGRGHHPAKALIEDAVKWISAGGLSNPYQSAQ